MGKKIALVIKGEVPSLVQAAKANELINAVNSLLSLEVKPAEYGKITFGRENAVLDLQGAKETVRKEIERHYTEVVKPQIDQITTNITNITNRLNAASIAASCNNDGTITVTLTL